MKSLLFNVEWVKCQNAVLKGKGFVKKKKKLRCKIFSTELWCPSTQCFCQTCLENTSLMLTPLPVCTPSQLKTDRRTDSLWFKNSKVIQSMTLKHDVVCPERTGYSRKLSLRLLPDRNLREMFKITKTLCSDLIKGQRCFPERCTLQFVPESFMNIIQWVQFLPS